MEGEKNTTLSEEGKELKKLLGGKQKRTAHSTSYSPSVFKKQLPEAKWKIKSKDVVAKAEQPKATAVSLESKFMTESDDVMVFAGIRIINPKVSSELLRIKMDGRKVIKMSRLSFKMNTTDLEGNWVTFGVIVHKSETRKSSNGNNYSIWKLSDLEDTDKTMTFFLFKDVYKQHWKCQQGTVLGLLNPNLMQKAEKFQSENSFTIDHPGQMLIIGQSKDLGICKGTTKTGKMCTNFINKKQSEYCTYHVQSVYKRTSAKRTDLQSGFTGVVPKSFSKKIIPTGSHVFYGGQTFSTLPSSGKATTKKGVNLQQLQRHNSSSSKGKVTTLTLHELAPVKDDKGMGTEMIKEQPFLDFLSTPTVGSLNLVKHLIKKENASEKQSGKVQVVSISPGELLKQHKQQANRLKQRCTKQSGGLTSGPQLGRGLKPGQDIVFGSSPQERPYIHKDTPRPMRPKNTELAKKQAIAKVLAKGGISKEDPNAVRKSKTSPQSENRVRKRVADHLEAESPERIEEPVQKRSRYLGNVDLNSEAIQGLLKAKSSHAGALAQLEAERHEKYFTELEKKEKCEQQMLDITQIKCTAYTCQQCKYTALSISDLCKAEGHKVNQIKGMKRFFKCQDCNTRTMTLHRYPTLPCRSCKGKSFIKTSMWKEKEGPKLESEILHVTGDTQKFLDSQIK
ncbi:protein MCM10 homolog [Liolophura sinensis]|uniref:protein MCM10 homolog n=1 Tax=Liolophura sinensis TaxID=3198878 RepID=UPI00315896F4